MKKEKSPDRGEPIQGAINFEGQDKATPKLSKRQKRVYELLCAGKHSSTDITIRLGYCHPASYIRDLREKGINILDEWVEEGDTRWKRYYIPSRTKNTLFPELEKPHHYDR